MNEAAGARRRAPGQRVALALAAVVMLVATIVAGTAWLGATSRVGDGVAAPPAAPGVTAAPPAPAAAPTVVGSGECASCHADEHRAWRASQHARAMQHATPETVLGDFNGARFTQDGVTSTFTRRDGRFFVRTDGPDGKLADFEVKYTFGVEPMQQYLLELPGGRLQALSITWDTRPKAEGGQRWFHQYPREKVDFRDELHWTKRSQNWNFMCADCHSTEVKKGFDAASGRYDTRWAEVSVGCESCHGPASAHIAWTKARSADPRKGLTVVFDDRRGVGWAIDAASGNAARVAPPSANSSTVPTSAAWQHPARELETCAVCHARRGQMVDGHRPGRPLLDHYLPSLLAPGLYHVDGQQRDEVFIWGSWLQSRMHGKGVTCSDCHDPHSQKLRAEGNAVCATCHAPAKYDVPAHHHHTGGSSGAQCANCHMPKTLYMVIDGRRDHSMRVPRPDRSVALGTPNACSSCHTDRTPAWAAAALRGWLGRDAAGSSTFAEAFHAADAGRSNAAPALAAIAVDAGQPPIVRASALERLAAARAGDAGHVALKAGADPQPLLRLAAAQAAATLADADRPAVAGPLLADPLRAVRTEAAAALAGLQDRLPADQRAAWQAAADEWVAAQEFNADRPEARTALGGFHARLGRADEALAAFAQARRLDPAFVPAYVNAADALRAQGREADAAALLEEGLRVVPAAPSLHHALGLSLVRQQQLAPLERQQQLARALQAFERAARLAPDNARYTYVHAVALHSAGRPDDAVRVLQRATERWPADRDMLLALATMQRDAGRRDAALATVQRLLETHPGDTDGAALAAALQAPPGRAPR
jgi:tetratricopeptide (TPR) repeat protein